jgi:hypothetical protein
MEDFLASMRSTNPKRLTRSEDGAPLFGFGVFFRPAPEGAELREGNAVGSFPIGVFSPRKVVPPSGQEKHSAPLSVV